MAYATSTDLALRFDENSLKDLASDTGDPIADLATDARISAALEDASGQVEAALLVGDHYNTDDLEALTGNSLGLLKRIVCELAMVYLLGRRPMKYISDGGREMKKAAEEYLNELRIGARLFDIAANREAGLPTIDGPSTIDLTNLNLITARTRNYYPHYGNRLPLGNR